MLSSAHRTRPVRAATCPFSGRRPLREEVSVDAFTAQLQTLRPTGSDNALPGDPRPLLGPGTLTWKVYGESAALLGAARALLLQFSHPAVEGLAAHSTLMQEPGVRFHETLRVVYQMAFGPWSEAALLAERVFSRHRRVFGRYSRTRGNYRAGDRYSATQIELLVWVAATITDTNVLTYESMIGPLSEIEKDLLVVEAGELFGLFGVPRGRFPASWRGFREYFDGIVNSGILAVDEHSKALAARILEPLRPGDEALYWLVKQLTARWLPPHLRRAYGFADNPMARATRATLERALRVTVSKLPRHLRFCPARINAEHRLAGNHGQDPDAAWLERGLARVFGVEPASLEPRLHDPHQGQGQGQGQGSDLQLGEPVVAGHLPAGLDVSSSASPPLDAGLRSSSASTLLKRICSYS